MPTSSTSERFYSGDSMGHVTVREGSARRLLDCPNPGQRTNSGFTWGRRESDQAELAFALLTDALADDVRAAQLRYDFHRRVISNLPERWTISRSRILGYVETLRCDAGVASLLKRIRGATGP
jgi:hypothetical protein